MENFVLNSGTKIIFGRDTEKLIGEEIKTYGHKVLLHYGGGSIKKIGLYDKVVQVLKDAGLDFVELSGVKPNPRLSLVHEGIELCRREKIDFILAVGGGSVIDSAKAIALGVPYDGDVWDFFERKEIPKENLPVGAVLTIAAAGSEASDSAVITNEDGWYKKGLSVEINRPKFAIMNPENTFSVSPYQTACGIADIMAHVMERYFTNVPNVDLTDRLCEGTLKSIIRNAPIVLEQPNDYDARAEIMWASTVAHNNWLSTGRIPDFGSHKIEHELSAIYDVPHGAGLAVIFPAWMKYVYKHDVNRFAKFANRVFGVDVDFDALDRTVLEGIERLKNLFTSLGLPVTLDKLGIPDDRFEEMAEKCTKNDTIRVGNFVKLDKADVLKILEIAK